MGKALYRDYRPKSLAEVVGQEQIAATLKHALETGKISHAYLFTGPRGVGKTSFARILAHEINGLPYDDDSTHLDIIEIDAASNRRIDEIRDLRDKVNIAPTSAKYKVYIIDEVHMLTREAFNALLKTLEEPPAHVVFILATTEVHKLPETIISRTQRFTFRPYPLEQIAEHLKTLAKKEQIDINDDALQLIAAYGEGSFRDSISLLDQTRGHDGTVDADYVRGLIGVPSEEAIVELQAALRSHNAASVHQSLESLRAQGFNPAQIARFLGQRFRMDCIAGGEVAVADFTLLQKLLGVPSAHDADAFLELILLEYALASVTRATTVAQPQQPAPPIPKAPQTPAPKPEPKQPPTEEQIENKPGSKSPEQAMSTQPQVASGSLDENSWPQILAALKQSHNTLHGVARMARPEFTTNGVVLYFKFAFHKKRLNEAKNQTAIINVIRDVTGQEVALTCELEPTDAMPQKPAVATAEPTASISETATKNPVETISNIFGGAELLES